MNPQIQEILAMVPIAALATTNSEGVPWSTPLHFSHDEQFLYWFSPASTEHSRNIEDNHLVSLTIWSPDESKGLAGVYLQSQAVESDERRAAENTYLAKFGEIPESFLACNVYRAPLGTVDTDKSNGQLWYLVNQGTHSSIN